MANTARRPGTRAWAATRAAGQQNSGFFMLFSMCFDVSRPEVATSTTMETCRITRIHGRSTSWAYRLALAIALWQVAKIYGTMDDLRLESQRVQDGVLASCDAYEMRIGEIPGDDRSLDCQRGCGRLSGGYADAGAKETA